MTQEAELKKLYATDGLTAKEIAKKLNVTERWVRRHLQKHKIGKPASLKMKGGNAMLKTKENLERWYLGEGLSITQIAERLGCTTGSVTRLFNSRNIPISKALRYKRARRNDSKRLAGLFTKRFRKKIGKELRRKRGRKGGYHLSASTKEKIGISNALRCAERKGLNPAELKMKSFLDGFGADAKIQEPIGLSDPPKVLCADFLIEKYEDSTLPIIIYVDGRYHHTLPDISGKDKEDNLRLVRDGHYIVIRIWDDELDDNLKMGALLLTATKLKSPSLLRYRYPDLMAKRYPKEFIRENKGFEILGTQDLR